MTCSTAAVISAATKVTRKPGDGAGLASQARAAATHLVTNPGAPAM
jgi:hypothetical protein